MQDLINKLTEKVGLSSEQATGAVNTVMEFVKGKLPEGLADKVESMFGGAEGEKVEMGGIMDSISGIFGGAKEKAAGAMDGAENVLDNVKDKAGDLLEGATDKIDDLGDAAADLAKDAFGKIKGMFGGGK